MLADLVLYGTCSGGIADGCAELVASCTRRPRSAWRYKAYARLAGNPSGQAQGGAWERVEVRPALGLHWRWSHVRSVRSVRTCRLGCQPLPRSTYCKYYAAASQGSCTKHAPSTEVGSTVSQHGSRLGAVLAPRGMRGHRVENRRNESRGFLSSPSHRSALRCADAQRCCGGKKSSRWQTSLGTYVAKSLIGSGALGSPNFF